MEWLTTQWSLQRSYSCAKFRRGLSNCLCNAINNASEDVLAIYMQEFWATAIVHRQVFEDLPLEQDILSFIRDLGHTREITYLIDVNFDYLHQPWRAFATVINKCLSGKETGMDKIHLLFQIEYNDAKKTNKMSYPRFTKIIIDYFMSKDPSISRRNNMFWHTARDHTLFTSMRCISRHEDTQKKPVQATKGTRLKSKAKVAKPDKKKQPAKKTKAKGCDGVDTQSKVPDEQQQKTSGTDEGTGTIPGVPDVPPYESKSDKESWGDSEDEDNDDDDGDNDDDGDSDDHDDDSDDERTESDRDEIPDPKLTNVDQTEHEEEEYDDEFYEEEEENIDDEETMYDEEDDEVTKELYDDVNVNLGNEDTDMTIADQGALDQQNVSQESRIEQVEEDAYVTLTPVIDTQKNGDLTQSSSVSSDFTSKLLNLDNPSHADNEIASLMGTTTQHATIIPKITSSFTITVPPPPPFLHLL
ncbi:putative reverse transcriptase domain-containing protein [Tanacetum coccineum]